MNPRAILPTCLLVCLTFISPPASAQKTPTPADLRFTRQACQRMIFDDKQALPLASLDPEKIVGLEVMPR